MKLNSVDREFFVSKSHDFSLFGFCGNLKTVGKSVTLNDERVVSRRFKGGGYSGKEPLSIVIHGRSLSMHEPIRSHDIAAENLANALMPQANAEERQFARKLADDFATDTGIVRCARTGRNADALGRLLSNLIDRNLVVSMHLHLRAQFSKILDQVVGKRIVVIDYEKHRGECMRGEQGGQLEPLPRKNRETDSLWD